MLYQFFPNTNSTNSSPAVVRFSRGGPFRQAAASASRCYCTAWSLLPLSPRRNAFTVRARMPTRSIRRKTGRGFRETNQPINNLRSTHVYRQKKTRTGVPCLVQPRNGKTKSNCFTTISTRRTPACACLCLCLCP